MKNNFWSRKVDLATNIFVQNVVYCPSDSFRQTTRVSSGVMLPFNLTCNLKYIQNNYIVLY